MSDLELWEFQYSTFCAKARWLLDYKRLAYREHNVLPGFHVPIVRGLTRQSSVPVLMIDGAPVFDSRAIARRLERDHPEPALVPREHEAAILEWETRLGERLGPSIRRAWFYDLLRERDYAIAVFGAGCGEVEQRRLKRAWSVLDPILRLDMRVTRRGAEQGWTDAVAMLDAIAAGVGDGYLVGGRFTLADLTAVALMAPLLPDEWRVLGQPVDMPASLREVAKRYESHTAVVWARAVYAQHRR